MATTINSSLIKPLFDVEDYNPSYAMHCQTEEEARIFVEYLHSIGRVWSSGASYTDRTNWSHYCESSCYHFCNGTISSLDYCYERRMTVLEFSDFNWGDGDAFELTVSYDEMFGVM